MRQYIAEVGLDPLTVAATSLVMVGGGYGEVLYLYGKK